jgi:hypothetical protein
MAITINGTTGIAGVDGSASTPAVQGTDTNTGVFFGTDTVTISTGGTAAVTVDSGQRTKFPTTIGVGGATPSTSGSGISFPASASASSDANTLDDYEEGTWTPSVGGTATYTTRTGFYTKIGRVVVASCDFTISSIGTGGTNAFSGLPFAAASASATQGGSIGYFSGAANSLVYLAARIDQGTTIFSLATLTAAATTLGTGTAVFANSTRFTGSITYMTD